jgi:hypothetical protein
MHNLQIMPVSSHTKLPSSDPHFVTPDLAHRPLPNWSDHNAYIIHGRVWSVVAKRIHRSGKRIQSSLSIFNRSELQKFKPMYSSRVADAAPKVVLVEDYGTEKTSIANAYTKGPSTTKPTITGTALRGGHERLDSRSISFPL